MSGILAVIGLRQARHREQSGFELSVVALAVSVAVTALHVAVWIHCGRPNFELRTTAHW